MKLFLAFLVVVLCVCDAKKAKKESPVVSLSGADFDTFVASKDAVLVKVWMQSCVYIAAFPSSSHPGVDIAKHWFPSTRRLPLH